MSHSHDKVSTNVAFRMFENGQVTHSCEQVVDWVSKMELKQDQILSITMSETLAEQGNNLTTVFYRQASQHAEALPLDSLKFHNFSNHFSWDKHEKEAGNMLAGNLSAVALTTSAKNVGSVNSQVLFYSSEVGRGPYVVKTLWEDATNYQNLAKRVKEFLNKFIAPHQLVSISFSDEHHPDEESGKVNERIFATITHSAGANPVELASLPNASMPSSGIYAMKVFEGRADWNSYFEEACAYMNNKGGEEGHLVAAANSSVDEKNVVAVFSWTSLQQNKLEDLMRPAGCCTLF